MSTPNTSFSYSKLSRKSKEILQCLSKTLLLCVTRNQIFDIIFEISLRTQTLKVADKDYNAFNYPQSTVIVIIVI